MQAALCNRGAQLLSARPCGQSRAKGRRLTTSVQANTLWMLTPDLKFCEKNEHNKELCSKLGQVDLTGPIGKKRVCTVASHDHETDEAIDLCILEHGGVHLVFEAEGTSNPLDSPSVLFVTNVDSGCEVLLDNKPLEKGKRSQARPGACLALGQEAVYRVERNVFAHA